MKRFKKELKDVTKEFDALTKKTKELRNKLKKVAVGQIEKAHAAMTPQAAAKRTAAALKALTKHTENLIKAVEKFEKDQTRKRPRAKTKAKARTARRVPAKKTRAKLTATDQVLKIIKGSKKGVDASTLMKRTGYDEKKVRNILFKAYKQGKIKRAGRGLYVGA